jgi:hypothetical protein
MENMWLLIGCSEKGRGYGSGGKAAFEPGFTVNADLHTAGEVENQ